jgi:ABC-type polysaccharide/polyol phosphate export permease
MSVVLIPMWLLSGAMFPLDNNFLGAASVLNPMSYLVNGLRFCFIEAAMPQTSILVLVLFCIFLGLTLGLLAKRTSLE